MVTAPATADFSTEILPTQNLQGPNFWGPLFVQRFHSFQEVFTSSQWLAPPKQETTRLGRERTADATPGPVLILIIIIIIIKIMINDSHTNNNTIDDDDDDDGYHYYNEGSYTLLLLLLLLLVLIIMILLLLLLLLLLL